MSMQYLEDFLSFTEEVPQVFCERLTRVRELDLEARNREDHARQMKLQLRDLVRECTFPTPPLNAKMKRLADGIKEELDRIVELSGEKIRVIVSLEQLMARFNAHLAGQTEKFKWDIEADSPGCTARLEQRAEEEMRIFLKPTLVESPLPPPPPPVIPSRSHQRGKRHFGKDTSNRGVSTSSCSTKLLPLATVDYGPAHADIRPSAHGTLISENCSSSSSNNITTQTVSPPRTNRARFSALMELTEISRIRVTDEATQVEQPPISIFAMTPRSSSKPKRLMNKPTPRTNAADTSIVSSVGDSEAPLPDEEEDDCRKYCFCEGLGGGLMVACDNADCEQEWFHGDCVGIKCEADIIGKKWYCPSCSERLVTTQPTASSTQQRPLELGLRPRGSRMMKCLAAVAGGVSAADVVVKEKTPQTIKERRSR
ncbi:hypothetical protein BV898_07075 [Hypsibius exemplaris]|uniref:Inhibitor of growth protein n=1 Tax=Hypsibius exemplaris TaxID=2072580 RepID=A0A1W0WUD0_HYPEX|nr:hypothetical protein BV898_07075 [Hypsibius exemplaris]